MSVLVADRAQIETFIDAIFRYASDGVSISLRTFRDQKGGPPVSITPVAMGSDGSQSLIEAACRQAQRAAGFQDPTVFCPPLAAFTGDQAREQDVAEAYAISVECDANPSDARAKLSALLGRPTVVVRSGGEWTNPETGEVEDKVHLHWRLNEAAAGEDLSRLKEARRLATALVGGDPTNVPMVHPIRWPGSWHRKATPRLAKIAELDADAEVDLNDALERLQEATSNARHTALGGVPGQHQVAPAPDGEYGTLMANIKRGEHLHDSITRLAAKLAGSGMVDGASVLFLRGLMESSDAPRDQRWQDRYNYISRAISTAQAKFSRYDPIHLQAQSDAEGILLIDPASWGDQLPPVRRWAVRDWIPANQATYFTGAGSSGKSLLGQQLATCIAADRPFLGAEIASGPALYLTCEDDADELHRRQDAICESLRVSFVDLSGRLHLASLAGAQGNELATFDNQNRMETTPAWDRLREAVLKTRAGLVVLDNVAHLFAGNENIRNHVAAFCGLLNGLAAEASTAIIFIGHPNKAGSDFSGSTAWENQVRSRIFLETPKADDGSFTDPDARLLSRAKSNYARRGETIAFRWHRWAFVRDQDLAPAEAGAIAATIVARNQDERFMACLLKTASENRATSPNSSASNYAPRLFAKMPTGSGIGVAGFEAAMQRLLDTGAILNGQRVYQRDNRAWVTGLGFAPTLAPTPAQISAHECTNPELSH